MIVKSARHRVEGLMRSLEALCGHFPGEVHDIKNLLTGLQFVKDMNRFHPVVDKAEQYVAEKGKDLIARNRIMNSKTGSLTKTAHAVRRSFLETDVDFTKEAGFADILNKYINPAIYGGTIGGLLTGAVAGHSMGGKAIADNALKAISGGEKVISRELINRVAPNVKILDYPGLVNAAKNETLFGLGKHLPDAINDPMANLMAKNLWGTVQKGENAFAIPGSGVVVPDKVNPSVLLHELGHMKQAPGTINFWNTGGMGMLTGKIVPMEQEAWDLANVMGKIDPNVQNVAMSTYKSSVPLTRAAAGGAAAGAVGAPFGLSALSRLAARRREAAFQKTMDSMRSAIASKNPEDFTKFLDNMKKPSGLF